MDATTKAPTCDYVVRWQPATHCGKPAVLRYPAFSGGWAHLCEEHGRGHEPYVERLGPDGEWHKPRGR